MDNSSGDSPTKLLRKRRKTIEYTHYWDTSSKPQQWAATFPLIVEDTSLIVANAMDITRGSSNGEDFSIVSTTEGIHLNGIREGHCPFSLSSQPISFEFCKTARQPYDKTVTAILIRAKVRAGDAIKISSDGDWKDWQAGKKLVKQLWPNEKVACPFDRTSDRDYDESDSEGERGRKMNEWTCPVPGCRRRYWGRNDNLLAHITNTHLTADEKKPGHVSTTEAEALGLSAMDARY